MRQISISKLQLFETCPYAYALRYIDKIPYVQQESAKRGSQIHDKAETFVKNGDPKNIPREFKYFTEKFVALNDLYKSNCVSLEEEWGFTDKWEPCDYKTAWLRMKLDARVHLPNNKALVIDYKTGRKFGNELKHAEQTMMYALAEIIREPEIKSVVTELWYLDKAEITKKAYTRKQALNFLPNFEKRLIKISTITRENCKPTPSIYNCRFCDFKDKECTYGVNKPLTSQNYKKVNLDELRVLTGD